MAAAGRAGHVPTGPGRQNVRMLTYELAQALMEAGLPWKPAPGDRFALRTGDMREQLFFLSDMTVELHEFVDGPVIGFNGTTEWALDSVDLGDVVWFPREDQMREALGSAFASLTTTGSGDVSPGLGRGYVVTVVGERSRQFRAIDVDVERAYARALIHLLTT